MTQIPENTVTIKDLYVWYEKKAALQKLQAEERALRDRVFKHWFPTPNEGVQRVDLGASAQESAGWNLVLDYGYDRKVDEQALDALVKTRVMDMSAEHLKSLGLPVETFKPEANILDALGINLGELIRWKPELKTKEWRTLTAEQHQIFDRILEVKPSSPQLKIEPSKAKKAELEAAAAPKGPPAPPPAPVSVKVDDLNIPTFLPTDPNKPPF